MGVNHKTFYILKKSEFPSPGGMQDNATLMGMGDFGIRQAGMAGLGFSAKRVGGSCREVCDVTNLTWDAHLNSQ